MKMTPRKILHCVRSAVLISTLKFYTTALCKKRIDCLVSLLILPLSFFRRKGWRTVERMEAVIAFQTMFGHRLEPGAMNLRKN
jgi:hypothetical protein